MFYYLKGTVAHMGANLAVIDCGGVGYACNTSSTTISALKNGAAAQLYTYCYIREDAFDIYGFASQEELSCFKLLIGVSGVGPKAALSILSSSSPEALSTAIITGNERALTIAPGIGKKIAQRIILELKDKLAADDYSGFADSSEAGHIGGKTADAAAALSVLGYSSSEIAQALSGIEPGLPLEETVRRALKKMVKN